MNRFPTTTRFAVIVAGAALTLGAFAGSAAAVDQIGVPQPDPCEQFDICGDKGPQPEPEPEDNGLDLPGDITDDPCNHLSHGCDDGTDEPEIDDVAPEAPVPGNPNFTG